MYNLSYLVVTNERSALNRFSNQYPPIFSIEKVDSCSSTLSRIFLLAEKRKPISITFVQSEEHSQPFRLFSRQIQLYLEEIQFITDVTKRKFELVPAWIGKKPVSLPFTSKPTTASLQTKKAILSYKAI